MSARQPPRSPTARSGFRLIACDANCDGSHHAVCRALVTPGVLCAILDEAIASGENNLLAAVKKATDLPRYDDDVIDRVGAVHPHRQRVGGWVARRPYRYGEVSSPLVQEKSGTCP